MKLSAVDTSAMTAAEVGYIGSFIRDKYPREKDFFANRSCTLNPEDVSNPFSREVLKAIITLNHLGELITVDSLTHYLMTEGSINTETDSIDEQPKTYTELGNLLDHYAKFGAKSIRDFRTRERVCKDKWRTDKLDLRRIEEVIEEVRRSGGSSLDMAFALRAYTERLIGETETVTLTTDWLRQQELLDEIPAKQREMVGKPRFTFPQHWQLDSYISVLRPGEMIVLSGGTGTGKSSLSMMFAEYSFILGKNVLVIHLEDTPEVILQRQTVRWVGGTLGELERGDPRGLMKKMKELRQHWADKRGGSLTYKYLAGNTMSLIVEQIKEVAREYEVEGKKLDVVLLDYFQKVDFDGEVQRGGNYVNAANQAAEQLKIVTQRLSLVTMVVSQETEDGQGNKAITYSKALGHKAQVHLSFERHEIKKDEDQEFVYIEKYGSDPLYLAQVGEKSCWLRLDVKKANQGRTGTKWLFFDGPRFKAYDKNFMIDVREGRRKEFEVPILKPADEDFYRSQERQIDKYIVGSTELVSPEERRITKK